MGEGGRFARDCLIINVLITVHYAIFKQNKSKLRAYLPLSHTLERGRGVRAVYKYSQVYDEAISNDTASNIKQLCMPDPFFISSVILCTYSEKDLTQESSVIETVIDALSRDSEMFKSWVENIESTPHRVYDIYGKSILLHLLKR